MNEDELLEFDKRLGNLFYEGRLDGAALKRLKDAWLEMAPVLKHSDHTHTPTADITAAPRPKIRKVTQRRWNYAFTGPKGEPVLGFTLAQDEAHVRSMINSSPSYKGHFNDIDVWLKVD